MDADRTVELLGRVAAGEPGAAGALVDVHRDRLRLMVRARMDRRMRPRVDVSDVVQEVCLEAVQRLPRYLGEPDPMPFFLWLRFLAAQRIAMLHRRHFGAQARDAGREVPLERAGRPGASSVVMAEGLAASVTSPSQAAIRREMQARLRTTLDAMDPLDREILSLRHFEQLTNAEAALELGLEVSAASKRYIRAFRKLRGLMAGADGAGGSAAP